MFIRSRQRLATFENRDLDIQINCQRVKRGSLSKTLGLALVENLTWKSHVKVITKISLQKHKKVLLNLTFLTVPQCGKA